MMRLPILATIAALSLGATSALAQSPYAAHFLRGLDALEDDDIGLAESELQAAFELEPTSPPCAYALACASAKARNFSDAGERLRRAIRLGFHDTEIARSDDDLGKFRQTEDFQACLDLMRTEASYVQSLELYVDGIGQPVQSLA